MSTVPFSGPPGRPLAPTARWVLLAGLLSACASAPAPESASTAKVAGVRIPDLHRQDHNGAEVALHGGSFTKTLVYFYPKDDTPGCTREACAFRDVYRDFEAAKVRIVGVSSDSADSHRAFATKHQLPFSLIADEDGVWAESFGVSRTAGMPKRMSFLLDPDGTVAKVYADVDPIVHAKEVLSDAQATTSATR